MARSEFNPHHMRNALDKIDGYFMPSPTKTGGDKEEFERAKAELLQHLGKQLDVVISISFARFERYKVEQRSVRRKSA